MTAVNPQPDGTVLVEVDDTLLGEKISVAADLVVLATGMVPRTALGEEEVLVACEEEREAESETNRRTWRPGSLSPRK